MKNQCQSCSMPLNDHNRGTEKDGSPSAKYCNLCYKDGAFINPDMTVEQMQETVVTALQKKRWPKFAAKLAARQVPKLERWQSATK